MSINPTSPAYHTPEERDRPTAGAVSDLTASLQSINATTDSSGEKSGGFLSQIWDALTPTPWKKRKRGELDKNVGNSGVRSSFDSMSGSAIRNIVNVTSNYDDSSSPYLDGADALTKSSNALKFEEHFKNSGREFEKLNLERKFDDTGAGKDEEQQEEEHLESVGKKARREYQVNGNVNSTKLLPNSQYFGREPFSNARVMNGVKTVRIAGTTTIPHSPYANFAFNSQNNENTGTPSSLNPFKKESVRSSPGIKYGDVRGRKATPAQSRRFVQDVDNSQATSIVHESTPSIVRTNNAITHNTKPHTVARCVMDQRTMSTPSYGKVYQRRASSEHFSMRDYRPKKLLQVTLPPVKREKNTLLNISLANQILQHTQERVFNMDLDSEKDDSIVFDGTYFGRDAEGPRAALLFAEKEDMCTAVKKSAPRVQMTRVLGSGQTGGGRFQLEPMPSEESSSQSVTSAKSIPKTYLGLFASDAAPSHITASTQSLKKSVTFKSPTQETSIMSKNFESENHSVQQSTAIEKSRIETNKFEPFVAKATRACGTGKYRVTPPNPINHNLSVQEGEALIELTRSKEWQANVLSKNHGFNDDLFPIPVAQMSCKSSSSSAVVAKSTKLDLTSSAIPCSTPSEVNNKVREKTSVAPFSFMPVEVRASQVHGSTLGATFQVPPETKALSSSTTFKATVPSESSEEMSNKNAALGWGNMFALKPGEWKCSVCSTKNPAGNVCLACQAPKADDLKCNAVEKNEKSENHKQNNASISSGGFVFQSSSTTLSSATTGNVGGFKFSVGDSSISPPEGETNDQTAERRKIVQSSTIPATSLSGTADASSSVESATTAQVSFTFGSTTPASSNPSDKVLTTLPSSSFSALSGPSKPVENVKTSMPSFSFGTAPAVSIQLENTQTPKPFSFFNNTPTSNLAEIVQTTQSSLPSGIVTAPSNPLVSMSTTKPSLSSGNSCTSSKAVESTTTTKSSFSFGITPAPSNKEKIGPSFVFGSTPAPSIPPEGMSTSTPSLSLGSTTSTSKPINNMTTVNSSFSFGSAPALSSIESVTGSKASFSFGSGAAPSSSIESVPMTKPSFSFNSKPTSSNPAESAQTTKPSFVFGNTPIPPNPVETATAKSSFSFGSMSAKPNPNEDVASAPNNPMNSVAPLGSHVLPSSNSNFAFGLSSMSSSAQPTVSGGFSFGGNTSTPAPATAVSNFGTKSSALSGTSSTFSFGAPMTAQSAPSNFVSAPQPMPAFPFGLTPNIDPALNGFAASSSNMPSTSFGISGGVTPGVTPSQQPYSSSFGAFSSAGTTPGGFSIGTSDSSKKSVRRIVKARRPPR